jgi:cytochrome P450
MTTTLTDAQRGAGLIGGRDHFNDFDLDSPEFNENYDEVLDTLLEKCPVAHSKAFGGYWFVSRAEDFRKCASDFETFTTTHGFEPSRSNEEGGLKLYPLELDPPYHTRWRSALGEFFSPRAIRSRTDDIRWHANFLIDSLIESGECDFVDMFAAQLPARVFFGSFLGIDFDELAVIQRAVDVAMRGKPEDRPAAWGQVSEWLIAYLKQRAAEPPRGDFIDVVLTGVEDDDGNPCSFEHKLFIMMDMMAGGMGTTSHTLASMMHHLATTPGIRERITDDPSRRPLYTEEIIRVFAPVVAVGRTATRDVDVAGTLIKAGDFVMLSQAAAAIDPEFISDPRTVNIDRKAPVNLAFSYGPHRCIGAHIGRLQMNIALDEILRRVHDIEVAEPPIYGNSSVARNMDVLKIRFTPGAREGSAT